MKEIKVKATLSNLRVGERPNYRMIVKEPKKVDEVEFLRRIAAKAGQDRIQGRYWLDAFRDVLFAALADNEAVDLNFLYAKLHVAGSLPAATEQPTKAENPVRPRVFLKGELMDALAAFDVVNDTLTVAAILYEVMQDGASEQNRIESPTARVVLNGNAIRIDSAQEDNGVWLEDLKTGEKLADGTVIHSDSATCHVTFPTLPVTGKYRLVLATRDGNDPNEFSLAKVTGNVTVIHEANA